MLRLFGFGRDREPVESPCQKVCGLNETNTYCLGCFRTPREIGRWTEFTPKQQREVIRQLPARRAAHSG
jgi:predicted Fe-S protein YdhL (DUF1289 family)